MDNYREKGALIGVGLYILANLLLSILFYKEFANIVVFMITGIFFCSEIFFWKVLFEKVKENMKKWDRQDVIFFILFFLGLVGNGLSRVFLLSSPYLNDLILSSTGLLYIIGFFRVLSIFTAITFIYFVWGEKNKFLRIISILNLLVNIMIWLEFDTNINVIIRILIGILLGLYIIIKEKNV